VSFPQKRLSGEESGDGSNREAVNFRYREPVIDNQAWSTTDVRNRDERVLLPFFCETDGWFQDLCYTQLSASKRFHRVNPSSGGTYNWHQKKPAHFGGMCLLIAEANEPGTVTELRSVVGILSVIPSERRYSVLNFSGVRPDPFSPLTVLVLAS